MGKINMGKVIVGGLLAGVVLNLFDYVVNGVILVEDYTAAMAALNKPAMATNTIMLYVGIDFVVGIGLVWLYAAIRPRFGAGVMTAVTAGITGWFFCQLLPSLYWLPVGIFPLKLFVVPAGVALFHMPLATVAGAWLYKE